jgi:hypothetical protein
MYVGFEFHWENSTPTERSSKDFSILIATPGLDVSLKRIAKQIRAQSSVS